MSHNIDIGAIKKRIKEGTYTLRENETKNASGAHWNTMRVVFDEDGNRVQDIYACSMVNCSEVVRTNLSKDGTGKLKRHYTRCNNSDRIGINSFFDREYTPPPTKKFKTHHKVSVNEAAVSFVVNDMRPVDSVTKTGLVTLLTVFTQIGAHYGKMDQSDVLQLLPSRFTTARHVTSTAAAVRENLQQKIASTVNEWGGALSVDNWLDKTKKNTFFGMTVHFIEKMSNGFILHDRILCTRALHVDAKSGDYIRSKLIEYMESYSLNSVINRFVFVSDRGSNIRKALEPYDSIHCFAHMVNNLVVHMLKDMDRTIAAVKSLVKYFKVSGLNSVLYETLKSFVKTRWNSVYYMLKSVIANWQQINEILQEKGGLMRLANIDVEQLQRICDFLAIFEECSKEIETTKRPTLHLVVPWYYRLLLHCEPSSNDCEAVENMKELGLNYLRSNIATEITVFHQIASLLCPSFKALKMYNSRTKLSIVNEAKQILNEKFPYEDTMIAATRSRRSGSTSSSNSTVSHSLSMFQDDSCSTSDENEDELQSYMDSTMKPEADLLEWWFTNRNTYPRLHKLACYIFAIPASSASVERVFSSAGYTVKDRPNLNPEALDDLLLLKSNHDLFESAINNVSTNDND